MLASDFMWNWNAKQASRAWATITSCDRARLRGRVDNNAVSVLEERLNAGFTLIPAEIDHANKNHKFGFGMTVGEERRTRREAEGDARRDEKDAGPIDGEEADAHAPR